MDVHVRDLLAKQRDRVAQSGPGFASGAAATLGGSQLEDQCQTPLEEPHPERLAKSAARRLTPPSARQVPTPLGTEQAPRGVSNGSTSLHDGWRLGLMYELPAPGVDVVAQVLENPTDPTDVQVAHIPAAPEVVANDADVDMARCWC